MIGTLLDEERVEERECAKKDLKGIKNIIEGFSTEAKGHSNLLKITFIHFPSSDKEHEG